MGIGPELPPHLQKRKRDSEEPQGDRDASPGPEKRSRTIGPAMPPSLQQAQQGSSNSDEINVNASGDDDDDDDEETNSSGPQPATASAPIANAASIGPSRPPPPDSGADNPDEINLESSDDDDEMGPAAPQLTTASKPRAIGPAMPPPPPSANDNDADGYSSSDDDMGPAPAPAGALHTAAGASIFDTMDHEDAESKKSARSDRLAWMNMPLDEGERAASKMDPTKLRNRRFASGPRAGGSARSSGGGGGGGMGSEWTETPEQKRQRLANAVMGVAEPTAGAGRGKSGGSGGGGGAGRDGSGSRRSTADEETERRIREYNERNRGESLVQQHRKRRDREPDDDPSKRAFDREKDIGGGVRISHSQKKEMLNRAAGMSDRFSKGSYL